MPPLPPAFLDRPIAHRALHDRLHGRPENSRAAVAAAVAAGYGIEIDLQLSADGQAMVFHDPDLDRLTAAKGPVCARTSQALAALPLSGGDGEGIPTLSDVLTQVAGRVPLLIELKDQTQSGGGDALERATAEALEGYDGPVALMSFNPAMVGRMAALCPHLPRGLTTCDFPPADWPLLTEAHCAHLRAIPDYDAVGASFVSHDWHDLAAPRVAALKSAGAAILCWTLKSPKDAAQACEIAHNITFEGYMA